MLEELTSMYSGATNGRTEAQLKFPKQNDAAKVIDV